MDEHGPFRGQYTKCHLSVIWNSWDSNFNPPPTRVPQLVTARQWKSSKHGHGTAMQTVKVSTQLSLDWFSWENLNRKPMGFYDQIDRAFRFQSFPSSNSMIEGTLSPESSEKMRNFREWSTGELSISSSQQPATLRLAPVRRYIFKTLMYGLIWYSSFSLPELRLLNHDHLQS